MPIRISDIWVYRIIHIKNLEYNLRDGLYCKNADRSDAGFVSIGSSEVISNRDRAMVKCYPKTVVNDYVPFYFSTRTPMLYNIITGHGVPAKRQENIVYLCCKLEDFATNKFQWCYTNGNAAIRITKFYSDLTDIATNIDWHSIRTTDFRDENADGDEDRIRKKHAEFLVKDHVPVSYIKGIGVLNAGKKSEVETLLKKLKLNIEVKVKPEYYF